MGTPFFLKLPGPVRRIHKNEKGNSLQSTAKTGEELTFAYPSYVQDIMGPMCFDYGFGPFRWVCASGKDEDLDKTDALATGVLEDLLKEAPEEIHSQLKDNIHWIRNAKQ
jgi:urocanate hydratase